MVQRLSTTSPWFLHSLPQMDSCKWPQPSAPSCQTQPGTSSADLPPKLPDALRQVTRGPRGGDHEASSQLSSLSQRQKALHSDDDTELQRAASLGFQASSPPPKRKAARALHLEPASQQAAASPATPPASAPAQQQALLLEPPVGQQQQRSPSQDLERAESFTFPEPFQRESTSSPTPMPKLQPSSSPKQLEATRLLLAPWLSAMSCGVRKTNSCTHPATRRAQGRKSKLAGKAVAPAAEPQTSLDGPLSQQPYAAYMPQPEYSFDSCATSWSWPPSSAGVAAPQLAAAQQQPDAQPGTVLNHVGSFAQLLDCDASQPRTLAAPRQAAPVAAQQAAVGTTSAAAAAGASHAVHGGAVGTGAVYSALHPLRPPLQERVLDPSQAPHGYFNVPAETTADLGSASKASEIPGTTRQPGHTPQAQPHASCKPAQAMTAADLLSCEELPDSPRSSDSLWEYASSPQHPQWGIWPEASHPPVKAMWPSPLASPFKALSTFPLLAESP